MALPSEAPPAPAHSIRRLVVGDRADRAALFEFVGRAWGPGSWHGNESRWEWQVLRIPVAELAMPFVFVRGAEILGVVGVIPVELCVGTERHPAAFAYDIMILREFWNRGAFPLLVREFCKAFPIAMGLGMNQKAHGLFTALRWTDIGSIPRLERYCSWRGMARGRTIVAVVRQWATARRALRAASGPCDLTVREVAAFDEAVTALWDRIVGERIATRRSAVWLNWRYGEQPLLAYTRLVVERDGRLVGCVVLRVEEAERERVGYVVECFAEPAALGDVVRIAVARLCRQGLDRICCDVLDAETEATFARAGFVRRRSAMNLMIRVADSALAARLGDRSRWYVTRGDADQDRPR